jgi:hypothetical protein
MALAATLPIAQLAQRRTPASSILAWADEAIE